MHAIIIFLRGFATASFTDENENLVMGESSQELVFLLPNGKTLPLLQNLKVPLRKRPPGPPIDEVVVVGGSAAGFRHLSGAVVNHVEQARYPVSLCTH